MLVLAGGFRPFALTFARLLGLLPGLLARRLHSFALAFTGLAFLLALLGLGVLNGLANDFLARRVNFGERVGRRDVGLGERFRAGGFGHGHAPSGFRHDRRTNRVYFGHFLRGVAGAAFKRIPVHRRGAESRLYFAASPHLGALDLGCDSGRFGACGVHFRSLNFRRRVFRRR